VVDNRSAGFYGIGGSFNFKSGDPSGTAAKMSQEKYGSEAMYLPPPEAEEDIYGRDNYYVDRSALLRATLNSLAMSNVASVISSKRFKKKMSMYKNNEDEDTEVTPESLEEVFEDSEE
jgi:hypothetical protein